ncbi:metal-dependent hydrolase, partial [candidate division KSB1 bacterium]|nr:metal-dependent hydrolase [candidate division KSB1 bacterium]
MNLRKRPENLEGKKLRIIHIDGLDYSACGGTHTSRTGEVGIIKIIRWERM